jgi:hypothetical protein
MNAKVQQLSEAWFKAEQELMTALDELPQAGLECNCCDMEVICLIHDGDWPEIIQRCLNCGGDI